LKTGIIIIIIYKRMDSVVSVLIKYNKENEKRGKNITIKVSRNI